MHYKRIWVAGHNGMVGSAVVRLLEKQGKEVIKVNQADLDLRNQLAVENWLHKEKPEAIIFAAAKVGGILANDMYAADFIYDNLCIATNIIHSAHQANINRLVFLGSSCIYPKFSPQPIKEEFLLTGLLEPTNEWYAIAKIAGMKLCQAYKKQYGRDYVSIMPCNQYGPNDNFDLNTAHVIPSLIKKIYQAKLSNDECVTIWGTGEPRREFMYVDDLASAIYFCLENYNESIHINCGMGYDVSIKEIAGRIANIIDYRGSLYFDVTKPDGTPRKLMDSSRLQSLGWKPATDLESGLKSTILWFKDNINQLRVA